MGMAASQARYLQLTARKTNVEYQGQQINQQRTELATESAGMFAKLLALQVPTAPTSSDYTTTDYKFNNGSYDCQISDGGIQYLTPPDATYNANVTYTYTTSPYTGVARTRTDLTASLNGGTYYLGTTRLSAYDAATDSTAVTQITADCPTTAVATAFTAGNTNQIYKYTQGDTSYYVAQAELDTMIAAGGGGTLATCYAANIDKLNTVTERAYITQASSGRYSSIQLESTGTTTFELTASTTTDTNAYNDAMNEYSYKQQSYQQQVTAINAKTSIIQQQDRALELQLNQLDTEQKALSTELDSVKKVIEKNVEQTFKTFQ